MNLQNPGIHIFKLLVSFSSKIMQCINKKFE